MVRSANPIPEMPSTAEVLKCFARELSEEFDEDLVRDLIRDAARAHIAEHGIVVIRTDVSSDGDS